MEHPDQRAAHRACRKLALNLRPRREGSTWKSWSRLMSSSPPAPARSCCALAFCPSFIHPATCTRGQSVRSSLFRAQNADAAGGRGVGLGRSQTSSARMVLALRDWSALAAAPLPVLRIFFVVPRCPPVTGPVRCGKGKGGRQETKTGQGSRGWRAFHSGTKESETAQRREQGWTACGLAALVSRGSSVSDGDPDAVAPFGVRRPLRRSDPSPALHCTGPSCDCGPVGSPPAISCRLPC